MNDREEVRFGAKLLLEALRSSSLDELVPRPTGKTLEASKTAVVEKLLELADAPTPGQSFFAFCFSEDSDQLGQWRGYADDGRGLVLEYDDRQIAALRATRDDKAVLSRVRYGIGDVTTLAQQIRATLSATTALAHNADAIRLPAHVPVNLPLYAALLKHEGFREEKEHRLLIEGEPDRVVLTPRGPRPQRLLKWAKDYEDVFPRRFILGPGSASESNIDAVRTMLENEGATITTDRDDPGEPAES